MHSPTARGRIGSVMLRGSRPRRHRRAPEDRACAVSIVEMRLNECRKKVVALRMTSARRPMVQQIPVTVLCSKAMCSR